MAKVQALGLIHWNALASVKVSGRDRLSARLASAVAIFHEKYSIAAKPIQVRAVAIRGSAAKRPPRPRLTAISMTGNPTDTPIACGNVRRQPKFAPDAVSIVLLGPGVQVIETAMAASAARVSKSMMASI